MRYQLFVCILLLASLPMLFADSDDGSESSSESVTSSSSNELDKSLGDYIHERRRRKKVQTIKRENFLKQSFECVKTASRILGKICVKGS
ncbi:unnamed protein product [Albugo candida]|uniref:RxLR effector protein n=1 Tax=Albugo candida TaxID=65357 RepID=A0A024GHK2_9STRA|nr:unnamed protein product [Albugo candida]|eukprot:CCI45966.1 unnamed protein product [Albugo candida]